jgi:hypothetical protein
MKKCAAKQLDWNGIVRSNSNYAHLLLYEMPDFWTGDRLLIIGFDPEKRTKGWLVRTAHFGHCGMHGFWL